MGGFVSLRCRWWQIAERQVRAVLQGVVAEFVSLGHDPYACVRLTLIEEAWGAEVVGLNG